MKIQNKQTLVPNSIELNDKDYLDRLLGTLKQSVSSYAIILNEASNDVLYKELKKHFDTFSKLQRETFELMFQNGWYQLETADAKKIETKYTTLENEFIGLDNIEEEELE
ncbi:MAG: spore coat protein [Firmicutes bacterium]|nr:spore coat protein [Bacillota bacterium]